MQKDAEEAFRRLAVGGQDDGKKGKEALLVDLDADLEDEDTLASLKPTPPSPSLQRALSPPTEAPVSLPLPSPPTQEPSSHSNLASHFLASSPAPISPSPNPTNSLPAEERIHHHHHHHHHHSHHAHSPPHAAPPPLRAATISATTDLSKIPSVAINNSSGATSPKDEKKKKGGFMGLVRSSSKNAEVRPSCLPARPLSLTALHVLTSSFLTLVGQSSSWSSTPSSRREPLARAAGRACQTCRTSVRSLFPCLRFPLVPRTTVVSEANLSVVSQLPAADVHGAWRRDPRRAPRRALSLSSRRRPALLSQAHQGRRGSSPSLPLLLSPLT
jgi:hypothetical protein